jgi:hypothetical protein
MVQMTKNKYKARFFSGSTNAFKAGNNRHRKKMNATIPLYNSSFFLKLEELTGSSSHEKRTQKHVKQLIITQRTNL